MRKARPVWSVPEQWPLQTNATQQAAFLKEAGAVISCNIPLQPVTLESQAARHAINACCKLPPLRCVRPKQCGLCVSGAISLDSLHGRKQATISYTSSDSSNSPPRRQALCSNRLSPREPLLASSGHRQGEGRNGQRTRRLSLLQCSQMRASFAGQGKSARAALRQLIEQQKQQEAPSAC